MGAALGSCTPLAVAPQSDPMRADAPRFVERLEVIG